MDQQQHKPAELSYESASQSQRSPAPSALVRLVGYLTMMLCLVPLAFSLVYLIYFLWQNDLTWRQIPAPASIAVAAIVGAVLGFRTSSGNCTISSRALAAMYLALALGSGIALVRAAVRYGVTGYQNPTENPLNWFWFPLLTSAAAWILYRWSIKLRAIARGSLER